MKQSNSDKGKRYARLIAIERAGKDKWNAALWRFRCDCGNDVYVARIDQVRRGMIKSCGCLRSYESSERARSRIKHGNSRKGRQSSEYKSWRAMLDRCRSEKNVSYQYYGGRGISVCSEWLEFETFLLDMGRKPTSRHSIGRINTDGNYEPSNCRWESPKQQARNQSNNRIVVYKGRSMTLAEACEIADISRNVVDGRLRNGWPIEKALSAPIKKRSPRD